MQNSQARNETMQEMIRERLTAHSVTPTAQRLAVADVLLRKPQHLTAEQVHAAVSQSGGRASLATVYNTLKLFSSRGLVREVVVEPGRVFYDSTTAPHHHFYDIETGELQDIPSGQVDFSNLPEAPEGKEFADVNVVLRVRKRRG